jgi:PPOX class probable F420-dependent enzyme
MAAQLSEGAKRLIEAPNFGHIATVMPGGAPQVTPVWIDLDGGFILVNTAEGRQKTRNLQRDAKVAISVTDQQNPYTWVAIRGVVAEMTHDGADAHIDKLAKKYLNQDTYPYRRADEQRVILKIRPEHVTGQGIE